MSRDDQARRYSGDNHHGPARSSPYPTSRLAPPVALTDLAREIEQAASSIGSHTSARLESIFEQMQALRAQAQEILTKAREDMWLHTAECKFRRVPGRIYHLYERADLTRYFSLLSPEDHAGSPPHRHLGSFRFEADLTFTSVEELSRVDAVRERLHSEMGSLQLKGR